MDALLKAVKEGNEEELIRLLDGDPALLEGLDADAYRHLAGAAEHGQLGVVKVLIERGAEAIVTRLFLGGTALHWAAGGGHEEILAWLLEQGAQANSKTADGTTPLMLACQEGRMGVVQLLLQHTGAQALLGTDDHGWTPLHWAADGGHEQMVVFLLGQGAQINSRAVNGKTSLILACQKGHLGVVKVLLPHTGAQALQETDREGRTALHYAALRGHKDVVVFLLGQGAQASSRNQAGVTPLMWACDTGQMGVVRLLLEHVGEEALQEADNTGCSALHFAAYGGHNDVVAFLLEQGAQANIREQQNGMTPFMWACNRGHVGVIRVLLQSMGGPALQEGSRDGGTALYWAVRGGHAGVVRLLLAAGADPTIANNEGRTPRALAEEEGPEACAAAFEWYKCEVERRHVLYRAACLHKVFTTLRDKPTSQVPTYLEARVAAGHALPRVEVVTRQPQHQQEEREPAAGASDKRKEASERDGTEGADAVEEEGHAVLTYVLEALDEHLLTELLEGFPS